MSASAGVDESVELKFFSTADEKKLLSAQEELFAIFTACELLERQYTKNALAEAEYTTQSQTLLGQYQMSLRALTAAGAIGGGLRADVQRWMAEWGLTAPLAYTRLVVEGMPGTVFHAGGGSGAGVDMGLVVSITSCLITLIDTLVSGVFTVAELTPVLREACEKVGRYSAMPADCETKSTLYKWNERLRGMPAHAALAQNDAAQFKLDVEMAYEAWKAVAAGPAPRSAA
jgi:hypothetical protein